jgi:hypothetical protein
MMTPMDMAWIVLKTYSINRTTNPYSGINRYELSDRDNNILSTVRGTEKNINRKDREPLTALTSFTGSTPEKYERQGHYGRLLNAVLQSGVGVLSTNRSEQAQNFHEKFQRNLPANLQVQTRGDKHLYSLPEGQSKPENYGDLNQFDYGSIPISQGEYQGYSPITGYSATGYRNPITFRPKEQTSIEDWVGYDDGGI